tara:strand:+ start:414 stop:743 length:330 start_codon:yes stop_codon:yes gene_type:complete
MSEDILSSLLDFGALGIFAGFLIWQHLGMQKRLDRLIEEFHKELKRIDDSFDARAELIRERYEAVITSIRRERSSERDKLQDKIAELQRELLSRERESLINMKLDRSKD